MANRYCTNCGNGIGAHDQFCARCGRPAYEIAAVPTPEADTSIPQPSQGPARSSGGGCLRNTIIALIVGIVLLAIIGGLAGTGGEDLNATGGGNGGEPAGESAGGAGSEALDEPQTIVRGKAAREREQNPKPGRAPLPKGDVLEVYYKTTGGAGYEAYAGADGITQPVYFTGPHYGDEHLLYHTDHNPGMTIDVTRMTTSGTVEVTIVHDGKQIAHEVANDSNHNAIIMGTPQDLTLQ